MKRINKKGQVFVFIVVILTAMALFTMFIGFHHKYSTLEIDGIEARIGMYASAIVKAYQEQEGAMIYLDGASEIVLKQSLKETGDKGGLAEPNCGKAGYNLWNNEQEKCLPDYEESLKTIFTENLRDKLTSFPMFYISGDHDITLKYDDKTVELIGKTDQKIRVAITLSGEIISKQTATITAEIPPKVKENVNKYNSMIEESAREHDQEVAFMKAIMTQESAGETFAVSPTGCAGLFQFCYKTAMDYFKDKKNIQPLGDCTATKSCSTAVINKDPRFKPEYSIPAAGEYLEHISNFVAIKDTTDKKAFVAASYNGGEGLIKVAIWKTGKKDPSWEEAAVQLSPNMLKNNGYPDGKYWNDDTRKNKIEEIKIYVEKVSAYYKSWGGLDLFSPSVIGYFEFGQNFRTNANYNLTFYDELIEFAEMVMAECNDNVEVCLEEKKQAFNAEHKEELLYMSECEKDADKVFYDFYENINDCAYSWGDNCRCQVTEEYSEAEIKELEGTYEIWFTELKKPATPLAGPITSEVNFEINLSRPKSLNHSTFIDDWHIWLPNLYSFKLDDELKKTLIVFYDSNQGKNIRREDFKNIFLVRENDRYAFFMEKEDGELIEPMKNTKTIDRTCPVAKQRFSLCAKTMNKLPVVKDDGFRKKLVMENSKIKFGLTLIDTVAPDKITGLTASRTLLENIELEWTDKHKNDLAVYSVKVKSESTGLEIDLGYYYIGEAEQIRTMNSDKLSYDETVDGTRNYQLVINSLLLGLATNETYILTVTSIDNFQNENNGVETTLLPRT